MIAYREIKVWLLLFANSSLDAGKSTPHSDSFIPEKVPPYPLNRKIGRLQSLYGCFEKKILPLASKQRRTAQNVSWLLEEIRDS